MQDSTGQTIRVGDRVRFRGQIYTIAQFLPGRGRLGTAAIRFVEPAATDQEIPDEMSVDLVDALGR